VRNQDTYKFGLGSEVQDTITDFKGIVISRTQWLHGCNTYGVRARELKDGKPQDLIYFDEPGLKELQTEVKKPERNTGGPCTAVPEPNRQ